MTKNEYIPFRSEILEVIEHTPIEYTFRMAYKGDVKPGQFFEVSLPKFGEAPISVSGIGEDFVDLTIRRVGKVTNEIFKNYVGDKLFLRGPYGNGFDIENYKNNTNSKFKEENNQIIMETTAKTENNYQKYEKLYVSKENGKPTKMEIKDTNQNTIIYIIYNEININKVANEKIYAFRIINASTEI